MRYASFHLYIYPGCPKAVISIHSHTNLTDTPQKYYNMAPKQPQAKGDTPLLLDTATYTQIMNKLGFVQNVPVPPRLVPTAHKF